MTPPESADFGRHSANAKPIRAEFAATLSESRRRLDNIGPSLVNLTASWPTPGQIVRASTTYHPTRTHNYVLSPINVQVWQDTVLHPAARPHQNTTRRALSH